jgi:hypothetical protein
LLTGTSEETKALEDEAIEIDRVQSSGAEEESLRSVLA